MADHTKPTFIVPGAAKSGTTSLYWYLKQHPDIFMSRSKEPSYYCFDRLYKKGPRYYSQFFTDSDGFDVRGEASARYFHQPFVVAPRIHFDIPKAKFVVLLRNPIEHFWSYYWYAVALKKETVSVDHYVKGGNNRPYFVSGLYSILLRKWFRFFPRERFSIHLMDELAAEPQTVCSEIFRFLDVDPLFQVDATTWYNTLKGRMKFKKPPIPKPIRVRMTERYTPDIERLQKMLDRDLSHWLKGDKEYVPSGVVLR